MTVERELSSDPYVPFIATSILNGHSSVDRRPQLSLIPREEWRGPATVLKVQDCARPIIITHPSSASAMATTAPAASDSCMPVDDDACWNLVPYDIPWGQDYYQYKQGTLPGPNGACLFLRSPTPVEKRRTLLACKMCRERKAKCSGDKPSCARCIARGYICQYVPETKKFKSTKAGPLRLKDCRSMSHPYGRRDSDAYSVASSTDYSDCSSYSSASSTSYFSPKQEELEFPPARLLEYHKAPKYPEEQKQDVPATNAYLPPYGYNPGTAQESSVHEQPPPSATSTTSSLSFWSGHESPHTPAQPLAPVLTFLHAPRPLRYSQSLPFLPSSERHIYPADVIDRPHSAESVDEEVAATVDPRVLTQLPPVVYYSAQPGEYQVAQQQHAQNIQAVHADQWSVQDVHAHEQYAAAADSTVLMQQYRNISSISPYPEDQQHMYGIPVMEHQSEVQYHDEIPSYSQQYGSPTMEAYGYPSFATAASSFV